MTAAFSLIHGSAIVYGQEDMARGGEIRKRAFQSRDFLAGSFLKQERHARSQKHYARRGVMGQFLPLEVFFPEGYGVVGQPVGFYGRDVGAGEADVVVGEVGVFG